jgi:hypothetical protein
MAIFLTTAIVLDKARQEGEKLGYKNGYKDCLNKGSPTQVAKLYKAERDTALEALRSLAAIIHRDGGQRQAALGDIIAIGKDCETIVVKERAELADAAGSGK